MKVRALLRSAAIWSGFAGVVLVAVPPMMIGYPLVLVDPNRAISDWWLRTLAKALVRVNPLWSVVVEGKEKLAAGGRSGEAGVSPVRQPSELRRSHRRILPRSSDEVPRQRERLQGAGLRLGARDRG